MPKKKSNNSSLKKPSQEVVEKPVIQQTKQVPKPGKLGKEIDDIFGGRKKKKPELEQPETKETKVEMAKLNRKRKRKELEGSSKNPQTRPRKRTEDGFSNNPKNRPRKRTEDGLLVFTEDELGINKANAGDTPLCPFDCDCCF